MTETVQSAESGPLSVDQAVESLLPQAETHDAAAPVEAAAEEIDAQTEGEEDVIPAETPDDDAETEAAEEPVEVLEPPKYWSTDAKAKFAALPSDLQAVVLEQEGPREAAAAKAKADAEQVRQTAQQEVQGVRQLADRLADFLPKAVETFQQRWGEPDWSAAIDQYGADEALKLKVQYEAEQRQLHQLAEAKQQADAEARQSILREENTKLIGTPLETLPARQEVAKYLSETGYGPDELNAASARDLLMAHKAMQWDRAQAALKAKPKTPAAVPKPALVRPGASVPQSSATRIASTAANRFAQTRSVDDAVALLLAKGQRQ